MVSGGDGHGGTVPNLIARNRDFLVANGFGRDGLRVINH
jgi:hypothetical protein